MQLTRRTYGFFDILRIPFIASPLMTSLVALMQVASAVALTVEVYVTAKFLDTAIAIVNGRMAIDAIYLPILFLTLLVGWNWLSFQLVDLVSVRLRQHLRRKYRAALLERRAQLSYRHIEDPDAWDLIGRVSKDPEVRFVADGIGNLMMFTSMILRVLGVVGLLFTEVWWAALIILAVSVPMFWLAAKSGKANYQAERDNTTIRRKYEYLSDVLTGREAAAERSMFGYTGHLDKEYEKAFFTAYRHTFRTRLKWMVRSKTSGVLFAALSAMIAAILLQPTLAGVLSLGMFMSLFNATNGMVNMLSWQLSYHVDTLAKFREYLRDLTAFCALETAPGALDLPAEQPPTFTGLTMTDVRFAYPGTEKQILNGLSLSIRPGQHYAFVGENGAGKTTIVKLLTGLYDNYEGEITLNGRDLRTYSQAELKALFSLVHQDFARYSVSVRDNIAFGIPHREAMVESAIQTVHLADKIAELPKGLSTPLGKIDGEGQDLSGGEWQRLAMARAVAGPAPLRILDEPTAALDPISESQVYKEFENISDGTTTLFISHRLGSTALADVIFVLEAGRVVESGDHAQLMQKNGLYAEMYASQRSWYE